MPVCGAGVYLSSWEGLTAFFEATLSSSLTFVRGSGVSRSEEGPGEAGNPAVFDFFRRGRGSEIVVELARLGLGHMALGEPLHDDSLLSSQWPAEDQLVSRLDLAMWFRALAVDVDLAALARLLSFGSGSVEAGDVEPEIQTHRVFAS
jgi:hypothetical protein